MVVMIVVVRDGHRFLFVCWCVWCLFVVLCVLFVVGGVFWVYDCCDDYTTDYYVSPCRLVVI